MEDQCNNPRRQVGDSDLGPSDYRKYGSGTCCSDRGGILQRYSAFGLLGARNGTGSISPTGEINEGKQHVLVRALIPKADQTKTAYRDLRHI